jgi:hypothetical protein
MSINLIVNSLKSATYEKFDFFNEIKTKQHLKNGRPHRSNNEFKQLNELQVHDKIFKRSHGASHAPKYVYPIIGGDYIEKEGKFFV